MFSSFNKNAAILCMAAALTAMATPANAAPVVAPTPSTSASADTAAGNGTVAVGFGNDTSAGSLVQADVNKDFTGLDVFGNEQTMNFTAHAQASSQYGSLHGKVSGTLSNIYYNETNDPYFTEETGLDEYGSPDHVGAFADAGFIDTLQFGGELESGYKAKYIFFIHGNVTNAPYIFVGIDATIGSNATAHYNLHPSSDGQIAQYFVTPLYAIDGTFAQTADVDFTVQFNVDTQGMDGVTVSGAADFSGTASLTAVQVFDDIGNPVQNYTVTGTSGTGYPVPEPTSGVLALLGLGGLVMRSRKRRCA